MKRLYFAFVGALCLFSVPTSVRAQGISLTESPYTENFDDIGNGLPAGWTVRTDASTTNLGTPATLNTSPTAWNNTSGAFKNFASGDIGADGDQAAANDRALGLRQTGGFGNAGAAFVLQLASTTDLANLTLSFDLQSLDANSPRVATWRVDYGLGATPGSFAAVPTVPAETTTGGNTFSNTTVTASFGSALDNQSGPVWIRIVTIEGTTGGGNRPSTGIDDVSLTFTGAGQTAPSLTATGTLEPFFATVGQTSAEQSYTLTGSNLEGDVTITPPMGFEISTGTGMDFVPTSPLTLSPTDSALGATQIFVRFAPTTMGAASGEINHATPGGAPAAVAVSGTAFGATSYFESFDECSANAAPTGGWTAFSVTGDQQWACTNFGFNPADPTNNAGTPDNQFGVQMSGFSGGPQPNQDWLISPPLDLTAYGTPLLSFWSRTTFDGLSLQLKVSTNYVDGDPNNATWTDLDGMFPAPNSNAWTLSDNIDLTPFKSASTRIAYVYNSNPTDGAPRATVDEIRITNVAETAAYAESFDECSANAAPSGGWSEFSVAGDQVWACTNFGFNPADPTNNSGSADNQFGVQINGFAAGAAQLNEDWLISPAIDLTDFGTPLLSFWSRAAFNGPSLQLKVSTNYVGGNPNNATWTDLDGMFPAPNSNVWTLSDSIDLTTFAAAATRIAFVYTSGPDSGSSRITVDEIAIVDGDEVIGEPEPELTVIGSLAPFFATLGQPSAEQSYVLTGTGLTGPVTITPPANFEISTGTGDNFVATNPLVLAISEGTLDTANIFVRLLQDTAGTTSGAIVHSTAGLSDITVNVTGTVTDSTSYAESFDQCVTGGIPGGWSPFSVTGPQVWACTNFGLDPADPSNNGQNPFAVQINGFSGGPVLNEDWLISPPLDLTAYDVPLLSYWTRSTFDGPSLSLRISTDYESGDPNAATWTEINGFFPAINSNAWTLSENINLEPFVSPNTRIAFRYTSGPDVGASRWTLDEIAITNSDSVPFVPAQLFTNFSPLADYHFGQLDPGAVSDVRSFEFFTAGLTGTLTVAAPTGFTLSTDSAGTFAPTLSYDAPTTVSPQTVFMRFAPDTEDIFGGQVRFTSPELDTLAGYLTGSALSPDSTFDVVTWNIEWFGSPTNGPGNVGQQIANVRQVIETLNADVYAFQEIANQGAFNTLVGQLTGYAGFSSNFFSGGGAGTNAQRVAYLYRTDVVDSVRARAIFATLSLGSISGYPGGNPNLFWANGRFPFLFEADVTIGQRQQRFHLVNIHARANNASDAQLTYDRRKFDVEVLKDTLDNAFGNANLILLGDYNDDVTQTVANIPTTESSYQAFVNDSANYRTVTRRLSEVGLRSFPSFPGVIDHITISDELFDQHFLGSERIYIPFGQLPDYLNTTSDHLPVLSRFRVVGPTSARAGAVAGPQFRLMPNPTAGQVRLQALQYQGNLRAVLTLANGQTVFAGEGTAEQLSQQLSQQLRGRPAGLYLLHVQGGAHRQAFKVVKY